MKKRIFRWLSKLSSYRRSPLLERECYSSHEDISLYYFGKRETISYLSKPYCIQDVPDIFSQAMLQVDYPQPFVLEVRDAKLRGRHAVAYTSDDFVILDSVFNHTPLLQLSSTGRIHYPSSISQAIKQVTVSKSYDQIFSLVNLFSAGFYHWLIDCLPRLWLLKQYEALISRSIPILIDPDPPDYVLETLNMMGISNIITWDVTLAHVNHLLIPTGLHDPERPSGYATKWVRDMLLSALGSDKPQFDAPRVYISRELATKRRVINESQIIEFLKPHGFKVFHLEQMTIQEQIGLFAQANIILGPHGAGIANTIFSSDATILEFFEPSYLNPCFFRLARSRGFNYGFLIVESDHLNMRVDVELLRDMMHKMCLID